MGRGGKVHLAAPPSCELSDGSVDDCWYRILTVRR